VTIADGGLATSGITARRWSRGDRHLHHLIDPNTGAPAAGPWRTVTVAAGSCVDANIASTAAIVLGHDAPGWLLARGLPARLVDRAGGVHRCGAWPEEVPAGASPRARAGWPAGTPAPC
jgi:thiamine biosynthesis lipoprotein